MELLARATHLDLLYSNSICKQSSIPTSILMELLISGGMRYECTHNSRSFTTSANRRATVIRMRYLERMPLVSAWHLDSYQTDSSQNAPQFDVDPLIALELLLNILECEIECLRLPHLPWCCQLL